jgi:hypothetical protein
MFDKNFKFLLEPLKQEKNNFSLRLEPHHHKSVSEQGKEISSYGLGYVQYFFAALNVQFILFKIWTQQY